MDGKQSTCYHLQDIGSLGAEYALKVMAPPYRRPLLAELCVLLNRLRNVIGLECCDRICLTRENAQDTLARYPEIEYAMLMPWIGGTTWSDAHAQHPRTNNLSRWQCLHLATRFAEVLATLEQQQVTHCSLSPEKVVVRCHPEALSVELLGMEAVSSPHLEVHSGDLDAMPEYQHPATGAPGPASDRFPGALLIAEILTWHDADIKKLFTYSESLFTAAELQDLHNPKFRALCGAIERHHSDLADLMRQAWTSPHPEDAPTLKSWLDALDRVALTKIEYAWMRSPPAPPLARDTRCWAGTCTIPQAAAGTPRDPPAGGAT
jgi:hypothetical protein